MKHENLHSEIEAFLSGQLSEEAKQEMEARIQSDPEFAAQVEEVKLGMEVSDFLVQEELKFRLKNLGEKRNGGRIIGVRRYGFALAAALILGLLAFSWIFIRANYSDQGLVASSFEMYSWAGVRGNSETIDAGIAAYNSKDYPTAIKHLEGISVGHPLYSTSQFYLGNIYLENHLNTNAIRAFQYVIDQDDSRFAEPAQWYISLAYLNSGNRVEAEKRLSEIAAISHHAYKENSARLLEKMQSSMRKLPGI